MTTRAASAALSRRVKQNLVNLLFKSDCGGKGRDLHRKLDFASYTYLDLRNAYLTKIKSIHPDKIMHQLDIVKKNGHGNSNGNDNDNDNNNDMMDDVQYKNWDEITKMTRKKKIQEEFVELQEAWDAYERIAKAMKKGQSDSGIRGVQENFTLFGVGCSFSDSVEESYKRAEIMDQAGKGWCSAGQLSETSTQNQEEETADGMTKNATTNSTISLIDDNMFEIHIDEDNRCTANNNEKMVTKRRSLVGIAFK